MMNDRLWRRLAISAVLLTGAGTCGSSGDNDSVDETPTSASGTEEGGSSVDGAGADAPTTVGVVSTDAPDVVTGLASSSDYDEQVVWRSADTGEELARNEILPNASIWWPRDTRLRWDPLLPGPRWDDPRALHHLPRSGV